MTRIRLVLLPLVLIGISPACTTGTETGNPPRAVASFELVSSDEQSFAIGVGAGVNITTVRIGIEQLAVTECETQSATAVTSAATVDLRDSGDFNLPSQAICEVELRLAPRDIDWSELHSGSTPNLSFGLAGITTGKAKLLVEDDATPHVVFRPQAFPVKAGGSLVLSLDVAKVLRLAEIQEAVADNDGAFVISGQQNASILASIQQRWATGWSLFAANGSGKRELIATGEAQ